MSLTEEHEPSDDRGHSSALPKTNHYSWEDDAQGASGGLGEADLRYRPVGGGGRRSTGGFRDRMSWVLLSVVIPVLIISVLRIICNASASRSSIREPGPSIRWLSDSEESSQGDSTLSQLIQECVDMEEDLGLSVLQEGTSVESLDAAEHVARIASSLYREALVFENERQQTQPAAQATLPSFPPSSTSLGVDYQYQQAEVAVQMPHQQQRAARDQQRLVSGPTTSQYQRGNIIHKFLNWTYPSLGGASQPVPEHRPIVVAPSRALGHLQRPFPKPGVPTPQSVAGPAKRLAAGWHSAGLLPHGAPLLPQDEVQHRSAKKRRIEASYGVSPELDPDSWLDTLPGIDTSAEEQRQIPESPQGLPTDQAVPASRSACRVRAGESKPPAAAKVRVVLAVGDEGEPSAVARGATDNVSVATTAADAAGKPSAGASAPSTAAEVSSATAAALLRTDWILKHPYVHLPVLEEGVKPPDIVLSASKFGKIRGLSLHEILLSLRHLFTKQTLNQDEANFLVTYVHDLAMASAAGAREAKRLIRPSHGLTNIGRHFLILDAMVSALNVLGVSRTSCPWWEDFAGCFDANYRYTEPGLRAHDSGRANVTLANRLLAAISVYKGGKRPPPMEVVDLKRTLFFSPYGSTAFKGSKWEPWRSDHLRFEREYPGLSALLPQSRLPY
ncbi:hypothetical protein EPH_0023290 [Eimeria praecox]|uniref:Transmembrane protein n=1 Tax=Eimeria praecox TaxID=51316 RepID=U6H696_9EIME|nr:hypothetical protein EPH_0023290 [Eimeria praecox]